MSESDTSCRLYQLLCSCISDTERYTQILFTVLRHLVKCMRYVSEWFQMYVDSECYLKFQVVFLFKDSFTQSNWE